MHRYRINHLLGIHILHILVEQKWSPRKNEGRKKKELRTKKWSSSGQIMVGQKKWRLNGKRNLEWQNEGWTKNDGWTTNKGWMENESRMKELTNGEWSAQTLNEWQRWRSACNSRLRILLMPQKGKCLHLGVSEGARNSKGEENDSTLVGAWADSTSSTRNAYQRVSIQKEDKQVMFAKVLAVPSE